MTSRPRSPDGERDESALVASAELADQQMLVINAVDDMLHPVDYAMQLYRAFTTPTKRIAFFRATTRT